MYCIDKFKLPFSATIKVPNGFQYDTTSTTYSVSVSTDDLEIHADEVSYPIPDSNAPLNPCNNCETLKGLTTTLYLYKLMGTLKYRIAYKFISGSTNFEISSEIIGDITKEAWSSADGVVSIVDHSNTQNPIPYASIGYYPTPTIDPNKSIYVILSDIEVAGLAGLPNGDIYIALSGNFKFNYK